MKGVIFFITYLSRIIKFSPWDPSLSNRYQKRLMTFLNTRIVKTSRPRKTKWLLSTLLKGIFLVVYESCTQHMSYRSKFPKCIEYLGWIPERFTCQSTKNLLKLWHYIYQTYHIFSPIILSDCFKTKFRLPKWKRHWPTPWSQSEIKSGD